MTTRTLPALIDAVLTGERRAIARAISEIERGGAQAGALCAALAPHLGRAHVVGLTGPPGAGKSTLVNALLGALVGQGSRVGVVAVDPSSPISGGALLGDRVRMGEHGEHPDVFVRSIASRGHLGGLSRTTRGIVDLLDAAGHDIVLVETVGAGQSEVEIAELADTCIVACPPGLGDEVQAIKAGILEIADLLVVTKGDLPAARSTARDLRHMTHLRRAPADGGWQTPVLAVTATSGNGIAALVEKIGAHATAVGRGRRLRTASDDAKPLRLAAEHEATPASYFGIETGASSAGASLRVRETHLDDAGACARSVIYALADAAASDAVRSAGAGASAVVDAHIAYLNAAREGDVLVAKAGEASRTAGGDAVWRVEVATEGGRPIATLASTVRFEAAPRR
ncbi:MAG TPA: methylmalonyl Co-A mutase-associated GTPase MeaB [Burkholderiaceae bacterium]|nr:methylmalonyl Co-A mutase-associated GTPase MeaB [Burkholderiaceae bacterium]